MFTKYIQTPLNFSTVQPF